MGTYSFYLGYLIDNEIIVDVEHLPSGSKTKVTAICDICKSESSISYSKYLINMNRNNKGYYSCFNCKNHVKEKTCLEKYGVRSYSMTSEFKSTESEKWKGIKKGSEKGKKTMMERYGVDSYFKTDIMRIKNREWMSSDEFRNKSKETLISRYGVDSYSKTDEFKRLLFDNKDIILDKIKSTFKEKYGNEYLSKTDYWKSIFNNKKSEMVDKTKNTCLEKYGVDNVSKVESIKSKVKLTKELNGLIIPESELSDWVTYKKVVRNTTKLNKKFLYENWDGFDYYDNEFIKGYASTIGSIDNLCITKRFINSIKNSLIEEEFISKYQL